MAKLEKITAHTNTLSMLSDFSITYPLRYSENEPPPFHTRITTANPSPHATHAADSSSARLAVGSWLPRCSRRSIVSSTTITAMRMTHCMRCPFETGFGFRRSLPLLPREQHGRRAKLADRDDDDPSGDTPLQRVAHILSDERAMFCRDVC